MSLFKRNRSRGQADEPERQTEQAQNQRPVFDFPEPESTAVTRRAKTLCDRLVFAGFRDLLMSDFISPACSQAADRLNLKIEWTEAELRKLAEEIRLYLGLEPIPVSLLVRDSYGERPVRAQAGGYQFNGKTHSITVLYAPYQTWQQFVAILCHEFTHYFMFVHKLWSSDPAENEMNTDITANLIGFRNQMNRGYHATEYVEILDGVKRTKSNYVGYITALECAQAGQYLDYYRAKLRYLEALHQWKALTREGLRQKTETAGMLYEQFLEELRHPACLHPGPVQLEEIRQAILAHESRDVPEELRQCRKPLEDPRSEADTLETANRRINDLLDDLLRWRAAFREDGPE